MIRRRREATVTITAIVVSVIIATGAVGIVVIGIVIGSRGCDSIDGCHHHGRCLHGR